MVTGPFPAERAVRLDAPGPIGHETDLVVRIRVQKALSRWWEGRSRRITLVLDGLRLVEMIRIMPETESDGEGDTVLYGFEKRLRLEPGVHEVSMKTEDTDFVSVGGELRPGRVHELVYEPVFRRHMDNRKRAMRTLNRIRRRPEMRLLGFDAYLDGAKAPRQR